MNIPLGSNLFSPDHPDKALARESLQKIKAAGSTAGSAAADQFTSIASTLKAPDSRLVASITDAAARASKNPESAHAIYLEGLNAIAAGATAGAVPLAGLVLHFMNSGYRNNQSQNKTHIADAALSTISKEAQDREISQQALLMKDMSDSAHYWDSSINGLEAALGKIRDGTLLAGTRLEKLSAWISGSSGSGNPGKEARQLKRIAAIMVENAIQGSNSDDRRAMAMKALEHLSSPDAGADPACRMAKEVIAGMRFTDTSFNVAVAALDQLSGGDAASLAGAAVLFMNEAYAGNHSSGKWVDEKTPAAQTCLRFIAAGSQSPAIKECATLAADMIAQCAFTNSGTGIAALAFALLGSGREPDDKEMAAFASAAVEKSLAVNNSSGRYQDDRSPTARLAADWLVTHAATSDGRAWGKLLKCALDPAKFTNSNIEIARAGFGALAAGTKADPASVAGVVRQMIEGSLNTQNSSGSFQADKSTLLNAVIPHLKKTFQGAERKAVEMLEQATGDTHFAVTYEQLSRNTMSAIEKGISSDRDLAALAGGFVNDAYAGNNSSYAYKDDKTGVALRSAQYLAQAAQDADVKYVASFLLKALDRVTFTATCEKVAAIAFESMKKGDKGNEHTAARLGRLMVEAALATTTGSGNYADDKAVIGSNILSLIKSTSSDKMTAAMASMLHSALNACQFSESCAAIADSGFKALSRDRITRKDIAAAAGEAIDGAINSTSRGRQDKGPAAVAIFKSLGESAMGCRESSVALAMTSALMDTGADYLERVKVAHCALGLWGSSGDEGITDIGMFISEITDATQNAKARYEMLINGVPALARSRGPADEAEASQKLKAAGSMATYEEASAFLVSYVRELASHSTVRQEMEDLAKALKKDPDAEKQVVEEDEYVLIGGVRLKKHGGT